MGRIHRPLGRLGPVALLQLLGDVAVGGRDGGEIHLRQRRHMLRRTEVGPDVVAPLAHRIGGDLHPRQQAVVGRPVLGHRRNVQAVAVHVELPAVVGAAQAAVLVAAKEQVGAPVRTARLDQADAALAVAEGEQVFAEDGGALGRAVGPLQFAREQDGHPEAAEQIAHRRARPGPVRVSVSFCALVSIRRPYRARRRARRLGRRIRRWGWVASGGRVYKPTQPPQLTAHAARNTYRHIHPSL